MQEKCLDTTPISDGNYSSPVTEEAKTSVESSRVELSAHSSPHTTSPLISVDERAAAAETEDQELQTALQNSLVESTPISYLATEAVADDSIDDEKWCCPQCTFINEENSATCDMCLSVRPRRKVRT